ncbi:MULTISPECIES: YkgJ family cysteine cluster protein [Halobacteriovorax]|uniref:YkgJ family cysteine cluster protein n=1 Tax=Halobacteriovorax vibrionivorans TaxID=2152716 RepID=A0ABY0IJF2_9BACT|nr:MULTISPECIES: YkgJ family cysteine cluster protein [Halobacteriovorax]RZF22609.1 YkgJ family cysteine cluster protein [Halobacteriovorax vibrionivorans]TGD47829.1 YkgJ family cysteine cluster protein [Halobacteriovorax sp. Y22]
MAKRYDSAERAQLSHELIDESLQDIIADADVNELISCRKGCSACCHTQVSVNRDEADLLAISILEDGIKIDVEKLVKQSLKKDSTEAWFEQDFQDRSCVFLDENGACKVYFDRPSVCRTNYAVSDPSACDTSNGHYQSIRLLKTKKPDLITIAAFNLSGEGGALPHMLVQAINRISQEKLTKSMKKNFKRFRLKQLKNLFNDLMM